MSLYYVILLMKRSDILCRQKLWVRYWDPEGESSVLDPSTTPPGWITPPWTPRVPRGRGKASHRMRRLPGGAGRRRQLASSGTPAAGRSARVRYGLGPGSRSPSNTCWSHPAPRRPSSAWCMIRTTDPVTRRNNCKQGSTADTPRDPPAAPPRLGESPEVISAAELCVERCEVALHYYPQKKKNLLIIRQ